MRDALIDLADREKCALIFTTRRHRTGATRPTPEVTIAACPRLMSGFGELMRTESLKQVPTAILSRQTAGIRGSTLIVNAWTARIDQGQHASSVPSYPIPWI